MRSRILLFALLYAWCVVLIALRLIRAHAIAFTFLPWNLFLAAIPAIAAGLFARASNRAVQGVLFLVWILFLPNAPYLVTDFVHLAPRPPVPLAAGIPSKPPANWPKYDPAKPETDFQLQQALKLVTAMANAGQNGTLVAPATGKRPI